MTVELLGKLDSLLRPLIERLSRDWYSSPLLHSFSLWCPTFLLVPFFSFLLLHFPNAISSQNTSDKHIDFSRSNVCCDGSPPHTHTQLSEAVSVLLFSQFFPPSADSMMYSEWERTVFILPLLINGCAGMTRKTKCYEKKRAVPPLHRAFLG